MTPETSVTVGADTDVIGLAWTLIRTDFKTRYHRTLGGFIWALLKPLTMCLVLATVFSFVFRSDPHYTANLIIGLFLWDYFAEATKIGLGSLHAKGYLLTKVRFPSWIVVVTSASNALITLGIFLVLVVALLGAEGYLRSPAAVALFAMYLFFLVLIVTGFSLGASVLFLKFRDLNQIWDVIVQAGFFVAPVIYPIGILPEQLHKYLYLWPPTAVIQFSRAVLVTGEIPSVRGHVALALMTAAILGMGVEIYRRSAPSVAERM